MALLRRIRSLRSYQFATPRAPSGNIPWDVHIGKRLLVQRNAWGIAELLLAIRTPTRDDREANARLNALHRAFPCGARGAVVAVTTAAPTAFGAQYVCARLRHIEVCAALCRGDLRGSNAKHRVSA